MPTKNMDCFFNLDVNSFTIGAVSPLNSGWYLAIPTKESFEGLKERAMWRLRCDWDEEKGWAQPMSDVDLFFRGGQRCSRWDFNGADMDQGLLTHYFVINHGSAMLVDTDLRKAKRFDKGLLEAPGVEVPMSEALSCCGGGIPTAYFEHFTGRSKPWMLDEKSEKNAKSNKPRKLGANSMKWMKHLDSLHLSVNSSNVMELALGSPLGFWRGTFPKQNKPCHA